MKNQDRQKWNGALALSALLHVMLVGVFLFGFPSLFEQFPEEQNVLTFETLHISEIANVKNETKNKQKEIDAEKSKLVEKTKLEPKQVDQPKKEEPIKEKKAEPIKEVPAKKEKIPEEKPKKKKETEPEPKKKPKPKPKKEEDSIDSILKNLENSSEGTDAKAHTKSSKQEQGKQHSRGDNYDKNSPLSITERLLIKGQIEKNWRPPVGSQNLKDIRVSLRLLLNSDGSVKDAFVKNVVCPINAGSTCKLLEESALRAVWQASPIENLLPQNYNNWKEFNIEVDPSSLAQ